MDLSGQLLGNYRIEQLLGAGGMGEVYRAVHAHLGRPFAVKVLHGQYAADATFRARFLQEARTANALDHPHIVKVQDFGEQDGRYYLVMEFMPGGAVRDLLKQKASGGPPIPLSQGVDLIRQAAEGLDYAHRHDMIHRDIKPDNILLRRTEPPGDGLVAKITDFGLVRMTQSSVLTASGVTMGTPAYISPEQCRGVDMDGRADIYSLGITLYEVATGYLPFQVSSLSDAVFKHVYTAPPSPREVRPDLPDTLEAIILRCLEKEPAGRYQTAGELGAALAGLALDDGGHTQIAGGQRTVVGQPAGLRVVADTPSLDLTPGEPARLRVTAGTLEATRERTRLRVDGVPDGWVTPAMRDLELQPSAPEIVELEIRAPRKAHTPAGPRDVTLRLESLDRPERVAEAALRWVVLPFQAGHLTVQPDSTKDNAFSLTLVNEGNAEGRYTFHGSDEGGRLAYTFSPSEVAIPIGGTTTTALTVRHSGPNRPTGSLPFTVEARAGDGPALSAEGVFGPPGGRSFTGLPLWFWPAAGATVLAILAVIALLVSRDGDDETIVAAATETPETATATVRASSTATAQVGTTPTDAVVRIAETATAPAVDTPTSTASATATVTQTATPVPQPDLPNGFAWWRADERAFSDWQLAGVTTGPDGTLRLDPGSATPGTDSAGMYNGGDYIVGEATGPETAAGPFDEAVASWNARTPPGTWIEVGLRVRVGGTWTDYYNMGVWTENNDLFERHSVGEQADDNGDVLTDTLVLNTPADAYQLRVRLFRASGGTVPVVQNVAVAATSTPVTSSGAAGNPDRWDTVLEVPECSKVVHADSAHTSAVSTAMVLAFWDPASDACGELVATAVEGVFDPLYNSTGNWPFNTAFAAVYGHEAFVMRFKGLAEAERWIAAGVPLVVSYRWDEGELDGSPTATSDGQLGVLVGFDESGNPVVNDPSFPTDEQVRITYLREQFEARWLEASDGMAYVIFPVGHAIPTQP